MQDDKQYHRTDERREDHAREPAERRAHAQLAKNPTADEGADDTDDDVTYESYTADDQRREYAGDQADDEPCDEVHFSPPVGVRLIDTVISTRCRATFTPPR